jgi:hypothetical protein
MAPPDDSPGTENATGTAVDPANDVDQLRTKLREKEQLVGALTQRLEQAAEQLDRLRRSGGDKAKRGGAGGAGGAPGMSEEHRSTFDDLKRVIANWEDMQAGATLGRIETQIVELRDLVANFAQSGGGGARAAGGAGAGTGAAASGGSWWERQKAAMLGESPPESSSESQAAATAGSSGDAPAQEAQQPAAPAAPRVTLAELNLPDDPPAIDIDTIELDAARQAIRDRDTIIQKLREPLLLLLAADQLPRDLTSLDNLPEPARKRLQDLENSWQEKFRKAEVEISIERARLAREQAALRHEKEVLEKQLKSSGRGVAPATANSPSGSGEPETAAEGQNRRRWFRFMGKSNESETSGSETPTK